ncbi:M61 family peptidase [Reichenbachiella agarivorans]|uniref:M61 family peptidase n=1 Tax=Reichenbachiella agarivorans TaxID=2979464 RepID=A0ABY6CWT4_9BACT|nr:M61 family peptidase [Reichenbachiella agarivorans]UXP33908.1 M61 family peptidase [Reichenbachiella agarivorans]
MVSCLLQFPNPLNHRIHVTMTFSSLSVGTQNFTLPAWRPGRYELAPFANNIYDFQAFSSNDQQINWKKSAPNVWSIDNPKTQDITLRYEYYAYKMDAGNSLVDEEQIYINFINCLFFHSSSLGSPHQLKLDIPSDYTIACALGNTSSIESEDYYQLVDSPLIASGILNTISYQVGDHNFHLVFMGKHPLDEKLILADFEKFTRAQVDTMGSFPCKDYYFLIQSLHYKHYHGVEHQNSTVLVLGPNDTDNQEKYREMLLGVASHELFHAWNVCRIRPNEMSPYDFAKETLFETGFVAEGFTTYYGDLFLKTSGVLSEQEYYNEINTLLQRHFQNYGRFESSLIQSSLNLWVDGYHNSLPSKKVSIYIKGALVSLILDIQLRKQSNNQHALIDVIKQLYEKHTYSLGGYSTQDIYHIIESIGGIKMVDLARVLVETTAPLDPILKETLAIVGCQLEVTEHCNQLTSDTGLLLDGNQIMDLAPNSPSSQYFSIGDQILQINGQDYDSTKEIASPYQISFLRNGKERQHLISKGEHTYYSYYRVLPVQNTNADQDKFKKAWINC